mgnify:CR=1 FL=1
MPSRDVKLAPGESYHVYNRGNNRGRIFFEPENYRFFLRRAREYLLPIMDVVAYCFMPTHYHFLTQVKMGREGTMVSNAMMRLSVSYTKAMNTRYDRVGSLFQGRFQSKRVTSNDYLLHLSRYIHLNPVLAGLVERAQQWEFSSYLDYIGERRGTLPKPQIVLSQLGSPKAYRAFVEGYVPEKREVIADLLFE